MDVSSLIGLEAAGRTDAGVEPRRLGQPDEDTVCVLRFHDIPQPAGVRALYAVADGLSSGRSGKVASAQAVNLLEEAVEHYARRGGSGIAGLDSFPEYLRYVLERIDQTLKQSSENNVSLAGVGTTATVAVVEGNTLRVAHAGDSRAYLFRRSSGGSVQITEDDTMDPSGSDGLGPSPSNGLGCICDAVKVHLYSEEIHDGDALLLCTDGLWRQISDEEIFRILLGSPAPSLAVDRLIRASNCAGGAGNVGVVVVHFGAANFANDEELDRLYRPGGVSAIERPSEVVVLPSSAGMDSQEDRAVAAASAAKTSDASSPMPAGARAGGQRAGRTSPFMRGVLYGATGMLLVGVLVVVIGEAVSSVAGHRSASSPPGKPVVVGIWSQTGGPWRSPTLEYKTSGESGAGERWGPLSEGSAHLNIGGRDKATLTLRISSDINPETGEPFPSRVNLKIGRVETQPSGVVIPEFDANGERLPVPEKRVGRIRVLSDQPGSVILENEKLHRGRIEAQMVREGSRYSVQFDRLLFGIYRVRQGPGTSARTVRLEPVDAVHEIDLSRPSETFPSIP